MKSAPTPPPAPAPVDPGKSALDYVRAMSDPTLQAQLLASEQQFRPQYNELNLADLQTYLQGTANTPGALSLFGDATKAAGDIQIAANRAQREADIRDVQELGSAAAAAFRQSNPELTAQIQRASSLQSYSDPFAKLSGAIDASKAPGDIGRGALGESLYNRALGPAVGPTGQALSGRALELAQSQGRLNPDEIRSLQQSVREAYTAQGRGLDSAAVSGEALARLTGQRQRMMEDLSMSSALNQGFVNEQAIGNQFAGQVQGANLARQEGNRAAQMAFQQQNIGNLGNLGQLQAGQLGADRAYALNLAQAQAAIASDPFAAILGRQSGALQYGAGQQGFAGNLTQSMQGPQLFNPDAGINLALQQNQNQANYNAAIYGAQASARGQTLGGLFGGLGALGGGIIGAGKLGGLFGGGK